MAASASNPILDKVRLALGRQAGQPVLPRPPILSARPAGETNAELDLLCKEINALSGSAQRMSQDGLDAALFNLVDMQQVRRATLWQTPFLQELGLAERLLKLHVEVISPNASKQALGACDLGVTEVDFALPETGTLGLLSSPEKRRSISLVPRVHLAVLRSSALRADLHQVFAEAKSAPYLIFITGPSRTSDIELTLTLGVHGPQALYVWAFD